MSNGFPPNQQAGTGNSTDRQQTPVPRLSDVCSVHAATSIPQVRWASVLSHATVRVTQHGAPLSWPFEDEVDSTSSTPVPSKQVPISSAWFRHPYQQPWKTSWLSSSPFQGCSLTTSSSSHPHKAEGAEAPELEAASQGHQSSSQSQVHAETQTHSTPAPHLAGCSLELLGILHGDNCHSLLTLCYPLAVPACVFELVYSRSRSAAQAQSWSRPHTSATCHNHSLHMVGAISTLAKHTDTMPDIILPLLCLQMFCSQLPL